MLKMIVFFLVVWFVVFCLAEAAASVKDIRTVKKNISYMDAESRKMIAQAILAGKVQTIVLPMDFKGLVNTGKRDETPLI